MVKEKRILSYFIGWLILGFIVCFIGIKNTYALVIDSSYLGYSTNTNFGVSTGNYISGNSYILVDQSNALNYYVVDICSTLNYGFSISNVSNISGNVSLYKVFQNLGSCNTTNYDGKLSRIYFKINQWDDAGNGNFGVTFNSRFNNTTTYYGDNRILNIYTTNEVDNTSEIINNQTNELNNSINNSTNTITGSITDSENNINQNIDDMEQSIVDSNKETQDVIKDQFNSCRDSENLFNKNLPNDNFYYNNSGNKVIDNYNKFINQKINTNSKNYSYSYKQRIFETGNVVAYIRIVEFDSNDTFIKRTLYTSNNTTFTLDENTSYFIISVDNGPYAYFVDLMLNEGSTAKPYEPYGEEICTNKLDEQNDKLNGIQGALTDSSAPNTSGLENSAGWLPPGPLDSVLNLPLSLFNALTTNLNKSCNPIIIPLPYVNKNITLSCINTLYNQIGITSFLSWIGVIVSGLMLYTYLLKLYKWIEDRISLNETHNVDSWGGL